MAILSLTGSASCAALDRDMIPDKTIAIRVAAAILEGYLGKERFAEETAGAPLVAELHGEIWYVFPYADNFTPTETDVPVMTGGGPVLKLSKRDAHVIDIYFPK